MTDLERLAAAILAQWRADGGAEDRPIAVSALLDRVLPYRVARRILGIDVSEDYEALVLRLLAEEEDLVHVDPVDATDMAKATIASRLPDLDVLQLLRAATMRFTERTITRLSDVLPMPNAKEESAEPAPGATDAGSAGATSTEREETPDEPDDADVIPLHPASLPVPAAPPSEPPADVLTTVVFTPPVPAHCWSCAETLPTDRGVKFCPFCGADQRQPTCQECGAVAERGWKHCPDCGTKL